MPMPSDICFYSSYLEIGKTISPIDNNINSSDGNNNNNNLPHQKLNHHKIHYDAHHLTGTELTHFPHLGLHSFQSRSQMTNS